MSLHHFTLHKLQAKKHQLSHARWGEGLTKCLFLKRLIALTIVAKAFGMSFLVAVSVAIILLTCKTVATATEGGGAKSEPRGQNLCTNAIMSGRSAFSVYKELSSKKVC